MMKSSTHSGNASVYFLTKYSLAEATRQKGCDNVQIIKFGLDNNLSPFCAYSPRSCIHVGYQANYLLLAER